MRVSLSTCLVLDHASRNHLLLPLCKDTRYTRARIVYRINGLFAPLFLFGYLCRVIFRQLDWIAALTYYTARISEVRYVHLIVTQ